jgi:vanillate O-demethylase monooxygenase subunit
MAVYVKNAWYVAAWSSEVGRDLFKRRIMDEPIVFFRKNDGTPAALTDRCPHKLLPLSMGHLVGDNVQCGYHGLEFDCSGACTHVPGQEKIPATAKVHSYPLVERYNAIWIWMGDPAKADPDQIHKVLKFDEPGWAVVGGGYQNHKGNYLNIAENLTDPAHTTYVHLRTIGNPATSEVPVKVDQGPGYVVASRWSNNVPPPPIDKKNGNFAGKVDRCQYYNFFAPCVSRVDVVTMDAGQEHTEELMNKGLRVYSYKFLTPETETATHFFWMQIRNFRVDDAKLQEDLFAGLNQTYAEDNVIVTAVQREQDATGVLQQTWLAIDAAPSRVRKMIVDMATAEQA